MSAILTVTVTGTMPVATDPVVRLEPITVIGRGEGYIEALQDAVTKLLAHARGTELSEEERG